MTQTANLHGVEYMPMSLAKLIVMRAEVYPRKRVLLPKAGSDVLAHAARTWGGMVTCTEDDHDAARRLRNAFLAVDTVRFLDLTPDPAFDVVLFGVNMVNAPEAPHLMIHGARFLAPGGKLIAVIGRGQLEWRAIVSQRLRGMVERHGSVEDLPPDTLQYVKNAPPIRLIEIVRPLAKKEPS